MAKKQPSTHWEDAALLGLCLASIGMLLIALFTKPPYPFFAYLKWTVGLTCMLSAWHLLVSRLWMIGVAVAASGMVQMFGRFRRADWIIPNWLTIILLLVVAMVLILSLSKAAWLRRSKGQGPSDSEATSNQE